MAQCPVCGNRVSEPIPPVCEQCGWDLGNDITLVTSGHEIPESIKENYQKRVEIAKRNWDERLQAITRQKELEKKLAEQEASERQRAVEYEFIKKCRESNDPAGNYREYLSEYPEGVYSVEAERAITEQVTKPLKSKNDSYKEGMYSVVCSNCGTDCEVSFEPTEDHCYVCCADCYAAWLKIEDAAEDAALELALEEGNGLLLNEEEFEMMLGSVKSKSAKEWSDLSKETKDPSERIFYLTNAIVLDPHYALLTIRGGVYHEKGQYDQAIRDYTNAIAIKSDFQEAYYLRGLAYREKSMEIEAQRDFEKSEDLKKGERHMHPAVCSHCGSDCEVPFEPTKDTPIYCTGCYYARVGAKYHPAVCAMCGSDCEVLFEPADDRPVYCIACDGTKGVKNEDDKQTKGILILGSVNTKSAKEWKDLGDNAEDLDEKILYYTNAMELDSHFALPGLRGAAYYKKGQYDMAIGDYSYALRLNPDFEEVYYLRGLAYRKKGMEIEAQRDFEKSEELEREMKK